MRLSPTRKLPIVAGISPYCISKNGATQEKRTDRDSSRLSGRQRSEMASDSSCRCAARGSASRPLPLTRVSLMICPEPPRNEGEKRDEARSRRSSCPAAFLNVHSLNERDRMGSLFRCLLRSLSAFRSDTGVAHERARPAKPGAERRDWKWRVRSRSERDPQFRASQPIAQGQTVWTPGQLSQDALGGILSHPGAYRGVCLPCVGRRAPEEARTTGQRTGTSATGQRFDCSHHRRHRSAKPLFQ